MARRDDRGAIDPLTPDVIIAAARRIASEGGFSAVSTRRIAQQFGVTATALYYHFANKQALLDRLAESLLDEVEIPPPSVAWQERLRRFVLAQQDKMLHFPGLNSHLVRRTASPAALRWTEAILSILSDAGFDGEPLWRAFAMLIFFVNPRTLIDEYPDESVIHSEAAVRRMLIEAPGRYPALARATAIEHRMQFDSYYEMALEGLIAGLEAELDAFRTDAGDQPG